MVTDGTMPHSNWLNHSHNHNLEMLLHIKGKYCVDEKGSCNILTTCIVKVGAHNPGAKMKMSGDREMCTSRPNVKTELETIFFNEMSVWVLTWLLSVGYDWI